MKLGLSVTAVLACALSAQSSLADGAAKRPIIPGDYFNLKTVQSPSIDPSGEWVAYSIQSNDAKADKAFTHIFMTKWDGSETVQLTSRPKESERLPRFSPDGRWLAFLSSRGDEHDEAGVWLLDRRGGEARRLDGVEGSVSDLVWSPDGKKLVLLVDDPDPESHSPKDAKPQPRVIDRFQFKSDDSGYLGKEKSRLWLYDLASGKAHRLTTGDYDEALPAFSPDGRTVAFTSKRVADPDRTYDFNLFAVTVGEAPAEPRQLTTSPNADNSEDWGSYPAFSPDGREIAYLQGSTPELSEYGVRSLAVISIDGGAPRILTRALDRNVSHPMWSGDGRSIRFLVEDDGAVRLAEVPAAGGAVTEVAGGRRVFSDPVAGGKGHVAALLSSVDRPFEVYALDAAGPRVLSHANDAWLSEVAVAPVIETKARSSDGAEVHGFIATPPSAAPGQALPAILYNHGGPASQFEMRFDLTRQILAGHGYVVVSTNPRGSTGRGEGWSKALFADWGGPAVKDAEAGLDDAIGRGLADPKRMGVVGWSYGGILTNYMIASDPRFRAAVSGASISNVIAGYGTDQYIRDYESELGKPWQKPEVWAKQSYPFLHNERITTPTLFLAADKDFNVPLLNSEQMYQALKSRGIDTELVIYPGEHHGLKRPSFLKDRMERYLDWLDRHLK